MKPIYDRFCPKKILSTYSTRQTQFATFILATKVIEQHSYSVFARKKNNYRPIFFSAAQVHLPSFLSEAQDTLSISCEKAPHKILVTWKPIHPLHWYMYTLYLLFLDMQVETLVVHWSERMPVVTQSQLFSSLYICPFTCTCTEPLLRYNHTMATENQHLPLISRFPKNS